ncbi:SDR family oxidoreductase [Streptomyces sp. HNM0663]|uniref:SDR family oxidoreductase n=1 Tax=Streptomyces chengmaiensis TaxID=3040919 RepID=A0ABT6HKI8_9ACTN|nr:SDR family oxidoreductase [Streptomyces chengmaiensis]MDH2388846.1 SDR family oxidoreductase [Streptomyces chengmaiensis]
MNRLDGRTALVTGGARGIGAGIVRLFADEGASVLVADVLEEQGGELAAKAGPAVAFRRLDVTSESDWADAAADAEERFGPVSLLVNNAGIVTMESMEDTEPETFRRVLDVNLYGPWLGMRTLAPSLRRAGGGVVLNVSSIAGMTGYANIGGYVASKWGLRGLTKTAALELARDGVRVCSIHPGPIRTPMVEGMGDEMVAAQPIPRFGTVEEVARLALFLAADATYCTGAEFVVDGGATAGAMILTDEGE